MEFAESVCSFFLSATTAHVQKTSTSLHSPIWKRDLPCRIYPAWSTNLHWHNGRRWNKHISHNILINSSVVVIGHCKPKWVTFVQSGDLGSSGDTIYGSLLLITWSSDRIFLFSIALFFIFFSHPTRLEKKSLTGIC